MLGVQNISIREIHRRMTSVYQVKVHYQRFTRAVRLFKFLYNKNRRFMCLPLIEGHLSISTLFKNEVDYIEFFQKNENQISTLLSEFKVTPEFNNEFRYENDDLAKMKDLKIGN